MKESMKINLTKFNLMILILLNCLVFSNSVYAMNIAMYSANNDSMTNSKVTFSVPSKSSTNYLRTSNARNIDYESTEEGSGYYYGIEENNFETLLDAISAAQSGDTIKVLQDVPNEVSDAIINKNLILDTNGFVLNKSTYPITINNKYSLKIIGTGKITGGVDCNTILNKGTLELNDATIENISGSNAYFTINNSGTVTINSGTISSKRETIKNNGTLNMYDGKILAETTEKVYPFGIKQQSTAALLNIKGGEIIAKGTATGYGSRGIQIEGGDLIFENAKILVEDASNAMGIIYWCSSNGRTGNITINSGTIEVKSLKDGYGFRFGASGTNIMQVTTIINDGNISVEATSNAEAISSFSNTGTIEVLGGKFSSTQYGVRADDNLTSLTIGNPDTSVNTTTPEIYGEEYGIFLTKGFIFNNGIVKGKNEIPYQGEVNPRNSFYIVETSELENNIYSAYLAFNSKKTVITEWIIPANADGAGNGTTILLPVPKNNMNSYAVDWGDGSQIETYDNTADFPTHNYKNTSTITYTIKVVGTVYQFGYVGSTNPTATNNEKNYYTFIKYVTKLVQWGELGVRLCGFSFCTNLAGTIPEPTENSLVNLTDGNRIFNNCSKLTGSIPGDLFKGVTKPAGFYYTFGGCKGLTGAIPGSLFQDLVNGVYFCSTFRGATGLTGPIPEELFANCRSAVYFEYTFMECTGLTGPLPENLFANTTKVYNMASCFSKCTSLTGPIPENLFANMPSVAVFNNTFSQCTSLNGSIPENLFANNKNAQNFRWMFGYCESLTGPLPEKLLYHNEKATVLGYMFLGCKGLTGSIPENFFVNQKVATGFDGTFIECIGLTGQIPEKLFANTVKANTFYMTFATCTGLTGNIPAALFANTPEVTSFYATFADCVNLTGEVPSTLFAKTPVVKDFTALFANCKGLTGHVSSYLFASNTVLTTIPTSWGTNNTADGYERVFYGCSNIESADIDIPYIGLGMFYNCNKLTKLSISDKVQVIAPKAFQATYPYHKDNLLTTALTTTNTLAKEYDWLSAYRTDVKKFIVNPQDTTATELKGAEFYAEASGDNLSYRWYELFNGEARDLTQASSNIYKSNNVGQANTTATTTIVIKSNVAKKLSFEYMVSSELDNDTYTITIEDKNGITIAVDSISGETEWLTYEKECVPTDSGEVIITATYTKNSDTNSGYDYGAIRNIVYSDYEVNETTLVNETENIFTTTTPNPENTSDYAWVIENDEYGKPFLRSNNVGINQSNSTAVIEIDVEKEATLSFFYRISSESGYDLFTVTLIDENGINNIINGISGSSAWMNLETTILPDEFGKATLKLKYNKDLYSAEGEDLAAIRDLKVVSGSTEKCSFVTDENFTVTGENWTSVAYQNANTQTLTIPAEITTLNMTGHKYYAEAYNDLGAVASETATLTVKNSRINLSNADVSYTKKYIYDGTAKTPSPMVMLEDVTLIKGIDYRVDYENNINSGVATLIITGMGDYSGQIEKEFVISIPKKEVNVTGAELPIGVNEPSADDIILETDISWTKLKEFIVNMPEENEENIRVKLQDIINSETGYNFVDEYGITERDDSIYPPVNTREYLFSGDVTGYVTVAIYMMDEAGNEKTEYIRVYNLDNTAPEIIMESKLENVEETKVQLKDSGSGLRYFGITSETQVGEPMNVVETDTINGTDVNTWYRISNLEVSEPTTTDAQDITVTFPRLLSGKYKFWAKDLVGNVSCVEFEVANRPLILESAHTLDRPWYEQNNLIDMTLSTKAERYQLSNKTSIGKDLIAKITIKNPNGNDVDLPNNMKFTLNGLDTNFVVDNNSFIYTVQSDLDEKAFAKIDDIKIDMTDLDVKEYLKVGNNTIVVEYYIGENNVPEEKVTTYEIELEIRKYKYYSILAKVNAQNGIIGEALLALTNGVATSRSITLDYIGDLEEPYVTIKLQKKTGTNSNGLDKYEEITNNVTVSECNPLQRTQEINANFVETLEAGKYQVLFELYDKYDYKRATEALNFKVN